MSHNPPSLKEVQLLGGLKTHTKAMIIKNTAPSPLKERLLSLGFIRDTKIEILERSLMGSTLVVRLCDTYVYSLRRSEADCILVEAHQVGLLPHPLMLLPSTQPCRSQSEEQDKHP